MMVSPLVCTKKSPKGENYSSEFGTVMYRYQGSIIGDNDENATEYILLITGTVRLTIEDTTQEIHAPAEWIIPDRTYHKIEALTDICFLATFS